MGNPLEPVGILGVGSYTPERIVTNDHLSELMDTSDEWIFSRTGIRERRYAQDQEFTSDMGYQAALEALKDADCSPDQIDYVLVGTASPDNALPSTAARICNLLGIKGPAALDISTACSGFVYSLELAHALILAGKYQKILVIGSDKLTSISDFTDRTTSVLFGDAAGAAVIGRGGHEIIETCSTCDYNYDALYIKSGGARDPAKPTPSENFDPYIRMNGREVYRFVVSKGVELVGFALDKANLKPEDIDLFIPHQANSVMLEYMTEKVGIPKDKLFLNIEKYGNTSSASVPLALDEAVKTGRLKKNDLVLLLAFGGGLSASYGLVRW